MQRNESNEPVGTVRWATFLGVCVLALVWSAYSVGAQNGTFLTQDFGAQYHLAEITARGAIPLVDFEHGWNAGSFWLNAILYTVAGGSPTIWYFLWGRLLGAGLGAVLAAAIGLRLRLHPAVMVALALGVLLLATPLHIKYTVCLLWVFVLLPAGPVESRPRLAAAARVLLPALVFWQYVELAVLLTGASGLFELVARRSVTLRTRLVHCVQLAGGFVLGLVVEATAYKLLWGLSFADFNRQVILGQAETHEGAQYAVWNFFDLPTESGRFFILALYPFVLLLPFVPLVWQRVSDSTRLVALAGLVLVVVPIRRVDNPHTTTVSALVLLAVVLAVGEMYRSSSVEPDSRGTSESVSKPTRSLIALPLAAAGAAWAVATLWIGFGLQSMLGGVLLVALAVAGATVGATVLRGAVAAVSAGALVVLGCVPALASVDHLDDMDRDAKSFVVTDSIARWAGPEYERCSGGTREALVMPNYLELYDTLELTNPTPYYLFHYDFAQYEDVLVPQLEDGSIPVIVETMPLHTPQPWLTDAIHSNYVPCSVVRIEKHATTVTIWTHKSRGDVERRDLTVRGGEMSPSR
ncbi:hypothetical protein J2S40_000826 [Nocardioides luteus]|uniref:Glycosyltransferase RgtA/B/C/D-like domain-containing protein n=1 Tax=Nocardioides luteus TaxID=1844 RepID=A0ABQ5SUN6_9ACTN|nr:hypothetical protein [Nocardioides luteus]MDR7309768.1 hypothetical protein [Nocardioides luteus]GGR61524.1 hypothetical protein GCM10010197_30860 [Nocardioides luteus]GLJ67323.1 hypothetical protein GCM10017579_13590 [Nocardioides luteus]